MVVCCFSQVRDAFYTLSADVFHGILKLDPLCVRPWYNSNFAHMGEGVPMRQLIEPLLYEFKTDVVFSGHVHAYERSHQVS